MNIVTAEIEAKSTEEAETGEADEKVSKKEEVILEEDWVSPDLGGGVEQDKTG